VRQDAISAGGRTIRLWLRKRVFAVRVAECFLFVALATCIIRFAPEANHLIWVANGVLLAYLLLAPRRHWPAYMIAAAAAQATCILLAVSQWRMSLLLTALNLLEALISALLLRGRRRDFPQFTRWGYLVRFIAFAAVAGPLVVGLLYILLMAVWLHSGSIALLPQWMAADGIGALVVTPACVAIFRNRLNHALNSKFDLLYLFLLILGTWFVFSRSSVPLAFLLYPLLLLVLLRLGLGWASSGALMMAGISSWFTMRGEGPFATFHSLTPFEPSATLQIFIAGGMFMIYAVSTVLESQKTTEQQFRKIASLHALVTEYSRDAIILTNFDSRRTYASAAVERLAGWTQEEFARQSSLELLHPDDRSLVENVVRKLRLGVEGAVIECRARKRNGNYIWVEASLRSVCDPDSRSPSGLLYIVRDISERKQAEKRLQDAYHALESLAITDGLTGLANRRRFDNCLPNEWRRAMRSQAPLSLLLIDVDWFKSYNDRYGHLRGDSCLKQIAEAAQDVVMRPGDMVARFGGEEFAVILPVTELEGAMLVAEDICENLRARRLAHPDNPSGNVSISVGCATLLPQLGCHASALIELADKSLYCAKRGGRNRVCGAPDLPSARQREAAVSPDPISRLSA